MASTTNPRGIPSIASTLIRPTARPTPPETAASEPEPDDRDDDPAEGHEGQGRASSSKPTRRRRSRPAPGGEVRGRKLSLPDDLFDRLQLQAIQKRMTVSAVAVEVLDKNLPRFRVEREG